MSVCNVNFSSSSPNTAFSSVQTENLLASRTVFSSASRGADIVSSCPEDEDATLQGVCGTVDDLTRGELIGTTAIAHVYGGINMTLSDTDPFGNSNSFNNTKVVCFTFDICRENEPLSGKTAHMIDVWDAEGTRLWHSFEVYLNDSGHLRITGRNSAGTIILDVTVTNAGATFCDTKNYMGAAVIDLTDSTKREIFINDVDLTAAAVTTWTTYTDDLLNIADAASGVEGSKQYGFGIDLENAIPFGSSDGGGATAGIDSVGLISFDDACTLVCPLVWDAAGFISDPQKWSGWYEKQPQVFFGPGFWKNTGKTSIEKSRISSATNFYVSVDAWRNNDAMLVNETVAGITEGT